MYSTNGWMDKWMERLIDRLMVGCMDRQTNKQQPEKKLRPNILLFKTII